jgi:acyl-CoA synthetase (AMP-forming)/AMP-acid ligase II
VKGPAASAPRHRTLGAALAAAAETDSGITFTDLHEREIFVPFRATHRRAAGVAAALRAIGVAAGDRVAIVLGTSPSFLDAFFGALLAGAVPVPLYPPLRLGALTEYSDATARMLRAVEARVVVTERRLGLLLGDAVRRARPRLGCREIENLREGEGHLTCAGSRPDDLALIQFSSGSTADPKPVALSHSGLMAHLAALDATLPSQGPLPQKGVSWLPLYHDMGLIGCLLLAVYVPGPLVLIRPEHFLVRPALWLRALARHRATLSAAPMFGYALCERRVADDDLAGLDLSGWRMALVGAEPLSRDALTRFARRFAGFGFDARALRPAYGLAEATLAVTLAPLDRGPSALAVDLAELARSGQVRAGRGALVSVGVPAPGVEVEVRGAAGERTSERSVGQVWVRGASVMNGYFGQSGATARAIVRGWLDTGDLGFTVNGELYICGRAKDLIIIRGANHAPAEFEACAAEVEGVRAGGVAACGFLPEAGEGEDLLVLAERARGFSPDLDAGIAAAIREALLTHTGIRPHTVVMLEPGTLPRTSSGKLRRSEARRRHLAGTLQPPRRRLAALALTLWRSVITSARPRRSDANGL